MKRFASGLLMALLTLPFSSEGLAGEKESEQKSATLDVPLPIGQKAKTLVFPFYDQQGQLQMNFEIGVATRVDQENMQMTHATIETYTDKGVADLKIVLPKSTLNLETNIITSDGAVTIERSDFRLTGEGLNFNTKTRQGRLTGNIEMLLYDRNSKIN